MAEAEKFKMSDANIGKNGQERQKRGRIKRVSIICPLKLENITKPSLYISRQS